MTVILGVGIWLVFVGLIFHSLVSFALSGSQGTVVAVSCLVGRASESLTGVATGSPRKKVSLVTKD